MLGLLAGGLAGCGDGEPVRATLRVEDVMMGDTAGYARATDVRAFAFPADHGPHPDFRTEWWYFTGNLESVAEGALAEEGRDFGFQLTFFRSALRPPGDSAEVVSDWATRQAYMGHFALTDIGMENFYAFERFERAALGLAGAEGAPARVWMGDWEMVAVEDGFRVRASEDGVAVDLMLRPTQPIVLQGDRGLSQKGPEPGNASYYYSMMRLDARGTVSAGGPPLPVRGQAWLDREWSTSALSPGIEGWDWFSIQLDDDSELMVYRLRTDDGDTAPRSAGTFVAPDGALTRIAADDFVLEATGRWTSPRGGRYPSGWRLRIPKLDLSLDVEPRVADQELDLTFRYWEGAVGVTGRRGGEAVTGKGYVELTGYAR